MWHCDQIKKTASCFSGHFSEKNAGHYSCRENEKRSSLCESLKGHEDLYHTIDLTQARNQLGTPGVAKSFLIGAQVFSTTSNSFQLCPTHFSRGGEKYCRWGEAPPAPP